MITSGNTIDIGPLTQGARELIVFTHQQGADDLYGGDGGLSYAMYDTLGTFAHKYLGNSLVGAGGEQVIGMDADGNYTQPVNASESYLTGRFDGICPVMLDDPIEVDDVMTFFVPALEFKICDVLGVARARHARKATAASIVKCFDKVAMPLVVQTPTIFTLS